MNAKKVLLPAITATSLMTLFSYIIAELEAKNFSEPELLARIEKKALPQTAEKLGLPAGWVTHYSVGVIMTLMIILMQQNTHERSVFKGGLIPGGLSGLVAIISWKLL